MGKFEDAQFPTSDKSIGDSVKDGLGVSFQWPRMSENDYHGGPYEVFKDGVSVADVQQGQLGDCYYLSALAVLQSKLTRERFVFLNSEDEWKACGAFCISFYDGGREDIVIVSDHLPLSEQDFVFVSCEDRTEIWAAVLEKAYAKKYGSYSIIEGGFVDLALAELTNGIPETISLDRDTNQAKVWAQVLALHKEGTLLGAGSPSHPEGDRAKSSTGIVQGHAYSVLKLVAVDTFKLICVRNPWGRGEWLGDWADDSELWTPRIKNLCGQTDFHEDGVFWMDFQDFCREFDEIYICRTYTQERNWNSVLIEDKWEGDYAQGIPRADNPHAEFEKNPQFGITVHAPGPGFVVLRLKEKQNPYKADQAAYLNLQANDGGLIRGQKKSQTVCTLGPRAHPLQPIEVEFPAKLSYPYTFTAVVANMKTGEEGHGNFSI
mgnify:CR=1 FL=1